MVIPNYNKDDPNHRQAAQKFSEDALTWIESLLGKPDEFAQAVKKRYDRNQRKFLVEAIKWTTPASPEQAQTLEQIKTQLKATL